MPPLTLAILAFLLPSSDLSANSGTISGIVPLLKLKKTSIPVEKYRGKISEKVLPTPPAIAGVWLERLNLSAPASPKTISFAQQGYQFEKKLLIIPSGTTVTFPNKDPDFHNIYSLSRAKRFDLGRYKKNETPVPKVLFDKAGFITLQCEIHEHMNAKIIVVDSPYYTATDSGGFFKLNKIPPGNYTLHAQVNRKTKWEFPVSVKVNQTTVIKFPVKNNKRNQQ